jgi:hypothetical protein
VWAALVFIASARVPVRVNAKSVGEGSTSPVPPTHPTVSWAALASCCASYTTKMSAIIGCGTITGQPDAEDYCLTSPIGLRCEFRSYPRPVNCSLR